MSGKAPHLIAIAGTEIRNLIILTFLYEYWLQNLNSILILQNEFTQKSGNAE